jgi:hypothetical protein
LRIKKINGTGDSLTRKIFKKLGPGFFDFSNVKKKLETEVTEKYQITAPTPSTK